MRTPSVSRRDLLGGTAAGLAVPLVARQGRAATEAASAPAARTPDMLDIVLQVNGHGIPLTVEPRTSLLDPLCELAGLTGTKKGCDCGACTLHVDDRRVVSCLTLAVRCQGKAITTIEGIAIGDAPHPVQAAFIEHDGFQCGYCTPGQIMSAAGSDRRGSRRLGCGDRRPEGPLGGRLARVQSGLVSGFGYGGLDEASGRPGSPPIVPARSTRCEAGNQKPPSAILETVTSRSSKVKRAQPKIQPCFSGLCLSQSVITPYF